MSRVTRCKFKVTSIVLSDSSTNVLDDDGKPVQNESGGYEYEKFVQPTVSMTAVKDDDPESENGKFWTATPSGTISLIINNPRGAEVFEVGKEYYVDFTVAD